MPDKPRKLTLFETPRINNRRFYVFMEALKDPGTYNPFDNLYFWVGFLWGLPIPLFFLWFHHRITPAGTMQLIRQEPVHLIFWVHPILFGFLFGIVGSVIHRYVDRLRDESISDYLTGLYNHRFFRQELRKRISEAKRYGRTLCVVLLDIDHFKRVNDEFGHQVGDRVLEDLADLLKEETRDSDLVFRYGGEEFSLILPETDLENAHRLAERIRTKVARHDFGIGRQITISGGVAEYPHDSTDEQDLIQVVDERLYAAKGAGRNQIISEEQTP